MIGERAYVLFGVLLLALPVASLIARRVPILRVLFNLAIWALLFAALAWVLGERSRFDPYLSQWTSALHLDSQTVAGHETRIRMSPDGHFYARVRFGGIERRMLIDSGATVTAVSSSTAAAAGLKVGRGPFPMLVRTANGTIAADTATIPELRVGDVIARDLAVVVSPSFGDVDVIGMNFLSRLQSWRVEGRTLILTPHHPQDFT